MAVWNLNQWLLSSIQAWKKEKGNQRKEKKWKQREGCWKEKKEEIKMQQKKKNITRYKNLNRKWWIQRQKN